MSYVQSPKHVFFDNSGNVLENGKIYIGQPGTDPRTNPKTVTLTDSGGSSFTASQPLRTIGGKIVYNGRPVIAEVDGEHSMLVMTSADVQVEYSASITSDSGAGTVDLSDTIRVGLVLDDVKAFDVSVGDVVRSVGRNTATDSLGADWLVISATGGSGDDVDLIDFDNGLQGQRDTSKLYPDTVLPYVSDQTFNPDSPTQVWSGSATTVAHSSLSDYGPGFYVVVTSTGDQYSLITQKSLASYSGAENIQGASTAGVTSWGTTPSSYLLNCSYVFFTGLTKRFSVENSNITLSNDTTKFIDHATSKSTITAIYKV